MTGTLNFKQNYSKIFDEEYSSTDPELLLCDKYCGKVSLYEITLRWLKTLQDSYNSKSEKENILSQRLAKLLPCLEAIFEYCDEWRDITFVNDLLMSGPYGIEAPEKLGKIPLGESGLVLIAQLLVNRVNTATDRALRGMRFIDEANNKMYKAECLDELYEKSPCYFEWKGSTSQYHLSFATQIVRIWRVLDESVISSVEEAIKEMQTFVRNKKQQKVNEIKKKDTTVIEKLESKKVSLPEVRMHPKVVNNNNDDKPKQEFKFFSKHEENDEEENEEDKNVKIEPTKPKKVFNTKREHKEFTLRGTKNKK